MPHVLGRAPDGGYMIATDSGQVIKSATLPPGLDEPGVLNVPGLSPPPAAALPVAPQAPLDPFSAQMRAKLRADSGIPETMTPEEMAAGKPGGKSAGPDLVDYKPGMGSARGGGPTAPGYAPARVIPGKMQLAAVNSSGVELDPEQKGRLERDQKEVQKATTDESEVQAETQRRVGVEKFNLASDLDVNDAIAAKHEQTRQQAVAEAMGNLKQAQDEFNSGSYIDKGYEKYGGRTTARIAQALAAMGVAATKGATQGVLNSINSDIDRYISEAREQGKSKVEGQQNLLAQMRMRFGDERQAEAATRATLLDKSQRQIDALVSQTAPSATRANAAKLVASLQEKHDEEMANLTKHVVEQHSVMTKPQLVGGAPPSQEVENKLLVKDLNGNTYVADSGEAAEKLRTKHALAEQAIQAANEMKAIANKSAGDKLDPTSPLGQQFGFAQERFTNSMNALQDQGVVRGDDVKRYHDYTGGQFGLATAKMADSLAQKARFGYETGLKSSVDTEAPAKREFYRDPKTGMVRRRAVYDLDRAGGARSPVDFTPQGGGQ